MRGVIQNRERKKQIIDFRNIRYNKITPTDIDVILDFGGRAFVVIEIKHGSAPIPDGQRICLENMVRAWAKGKTKAIAITAVHFVDNCNDDVMLDECIVNELYMSDEKKWRPPKKPMTVKELVDTYHKLVSTI